MFTQLKEAGRLKVSILLFVMTMFCFSLSVLRVFVSRSPIFLFLNWNLFLAFIPWAVTTLIVLLNKQRIHKIGMLLLLVFWLLFFPNSPYILTDLFHLKLRSSVPIWFDLVLILSFAWTGLAFGFISLFDIESLLSKYIKPIFVQMISVLMLFLGSFGVYIGRYLRFNSWDVINYPGLLIENIGDRFINPFSHPRTWAITILIGLLLNMMYWTFKLIRQSRQV